MLRLNKILVFFIAFFFIANRVVSQESGSETPVQNDYKDAAQHKNFHTIRKIVSEWQIHQLKNGALVVRLKTNQLLVEALIKSDNRRLAEKKRLEQLAKNLNTMKAYRKNYRFSKLYFILANSSDTLLKGARKNIFLDSNMIVDSSIIMLESFYLIAETDNLYNSSIGYVKESEAASQIEHGSKTTTEALVVLKNKYGHQLKHPFPYRAYEVPPVKSVLSALTNAAPIINDYYGIKSKNPDVYIFENLPLELTIPKNFNYTNFVKYVGNLNAILFKYYKNTDAPNLNEIDPKIKQFLY